MSLRKYCALSMLLLICGCVTNSPNIKESMLLDTPKDFYEFLRTNSLNVEVVVHGFASGTIQDCDGVIRQVTGDFWKAEFIYNKPSIIWFKHGTQNVIECSKGWGLSPNEAVENLLTNSKKFDTMIVEFKDETQPRVEINIRKDLFKL